MDKTNLTPSLGIFPMLFSDEFPKEFYDFIYGSVHHHNYADGRADYLIERFGKVKFLDVGCACGILVKALRDKGAEAWGIDPSVYAISQSCAPEYTQVGDVRSIPFENGFFDVVHSQAVHGYYPESDIEQAIAECKRAGSEQFHNIDTNCHVPEAGYKFMRSIEYWQDIFPDRIG